MNTYIVLAQSKKEVKVVYVGHSEKTAHRTFVRYSNINGVDGVYYKPSVECWTNEERSFDLEEEFWANI